MAINPRNYRSKARLNPVNLKIRLRKRGAPPSHDEALIVLDGILATGRVARGWQFFVVDYEHPRSSRPWRGQSADVVDLQAFRSVLEAMRDKLRVSTPRRVEG